jgi:hemoglobin
MRSLPFAVPVGAGWTEGDLRDADDVEELVRAFYRRAATDGLLGPVFEAAGVDWSAHIPKLVEFWSWQLFGTPGYEGHPLLAHRPLQAATPFRDAHYARWLEIFDDTVDERFAGPLAEAAKARAAKMATALRRLLADCPADLPATPGETGEAGEPCETAG